jgi:hypothetical protein
VQAQTIARQPGNTNLNTSKGKAKQRVLAEPMGMSKSWKKAQAKAILDDRNTEDLKIRSSRYGEEIKRTVELIIYFKASVFHFYYFNNTQIFLYRKTLSRLSPRFSLIPIPS